MQLSNDERRMLSLDDVRSYDRNADILMEYALISPQKVRCLFEQAARLLMRENELRNENSDLRVVIAKLLGLINDIKEMDGIFFPDDINYAITEARKVLGKEPK